MPLKTVLVYILAEKEADVPARVSGKDVQIARAGKRMIVLTKCDDLGRISASARSAFDTLLAAGVLECADSPGLPALNTNGEGGDPHGLENSIRASG